VLLVSLALVAGVVPVSSARAASTEDELRAAREELERVQREADDLTARYEAAYARQSELETQIARLHDEVATKEQRAGTLRVAVAARAAEAYKSSGRLAFVPALWEPDVLAMQRRVRLLEQVNAEGNDVIDELGALGEDLEAKRAELESALAEQRALVTSLRDDASALEDRLVAAQELRARLADRLAQEEAFAAVVEEQRAAQARAQRQQAAQTTQPSAAPAVSSSGSGDDAPAPRASIVCPIAGAVSFVDSWGAPRSGGRRHQGVDLMAAPGTPNVAVVSGTVSQQSGSLSGLGVYLYGDDGNTYYYFHLSAYEGGPRHVAQGEVVGYTGSTGNAVGGPSHTHFEYHPGGGGAVNPYPLVRPVC
jgi:murein DD-endopeptidase MepM/ murein hydrolase activator NlpD